MTQTNLGPPNAAPAPALSGPRPRIQTLSDMVFGLALSLGALVLIGQTPQDPDHLYTGVGLFAFSFIILVTVWYNYSTVMGLLPIETRGLVFANLVLLFVVALEPYLLFVVAFHVPDPVGEAASVLYAVDLAVMNAILAGFVHVLAQEDRGLVPASMLKRMRSIRDVNIIFAVVFLLSLAPVFWTWTWYGDMPGRILIWVLMLPVGWAVRLARR